MDLTNNLSNSATTTTLASSSSSSSNPPKRIRIDNDDFFEKTSRSRLLEYWKEQDLYIDYLETRLNQLAQSIDSNEHLREKETECKKLKSMLNYRILTKTTQQQAFDQMRDMMQTPSLGRLRQTFLDPSINLIYGQMRDEIEHCRKARDDAQNELQAWQFTSDSKTGKMLMARCKKLLEENEQLGKVVSSDNVAKLEGEIALQNRLLTNMKDAQKDYEEIMLDMDTNMDAMSSTLLHMRQQLNESHRQITILNEENARLKTLCQSTTSNGTNHTDTASALSSTTTNNNVKLPQKRPHPSNRTTQNLVSTQKLKPATNLYDVDETNSPPPPPPPILPPSSSSSISSAQDLSSQNEMMETEPNTLTSSSMNSTNNNTNNNINNNNNQHIKKTNLLENGINVTP